MSGTLIGISDEGIRIFSEVRDEKIYVWGWMPEVGRIELSSVEIIRGVDPELRKMGESPADRIRVVVA